MGKKLTTNEFIERSSKIHNYKYDYSKSEYITNKTKVCITCPIHGDFYQEAKAHFKGGNCPKCSCKHNKTTEEFIIEAKNIHGDKYIYTKSDYITALSKICIICPEHGEFYQEANTHLRGCGCPKCSGTYLDKDLFIKKSIMIHGNKYDYSKVNFINSITKVSIICPKHGEFKQTPNKHMQQNGCPICNESKLETNVRRLLIKNNINFISQYTCKWLGRQSLDFYLPDYNIAIECQGRQHFEINDFFGGENDFKLRVKYDLLKYKLCSDYKIKLLYFSKEKNIDFSNYIDKVYVNEIELLNTILI